jgi:hypothetical protein
MPDNVDLSISKRILDSKSCMPDNVDVCRFMCDIVVNTKKRAVVNMVVNTKKRVE